MRWLFPEIVQWSQWFDKETVFYKFSSCDLLPMVETVGQIVSMCCVLKAHLDKYNKLFQAKDKKTFKCHFPSDASQW